ncbi:hypothetical protein CTI12_AA394630 [Artemisia annua]|uniref:Glycoside hydrolase family 3 C-terminal domain-containing protein n=1 Tax=Artemisia annua TaxID=35608 RepID=A0A2U1MCQ3_ARTAN|nr:hypothetical protein CTI12_AA394630 [Artemisia annua]
MVNRTISPKKREPTNQATRPTKMATETMMMAGTHNANHMGKKQVKDQSPRIKKSADRKPRSVSPSNSPEYLTGEKFVSSLRVQRSKNGVNKKCFQPEQSKVQSIVSELKTRHPKINCINTTQNNERRDLRQDNDTVSMKSVTKIELEVARNISQKKIGGWTRWLFNYFAERLIEDEPAVEFSRLNVEQPSPISVLDAFYVEDTPSPGKNKPYAFNDIKLKSERMYQFDLFTHDSTVYQYTSSRCNVFRTCQSLNNSCGPIDVSFVEKDPKIRATLWVAYPGQAGGTAIADVFIWNTLSRLPIKGTDDNNGHEINQSKWLPCRTYRFYKGPVMYPFGHGINYSNFINILTNVPALFTFSVKGCHKYLNLTKNAIGVKHAKCDGLSTGLQVDVEEIKCSGAELLETYREGNLEMGEIHLQFYGLSIIAMDTNNFIENNVADGSIIGDHKRISGMSVTKIRSEQNINAPDYSHLCRGWSTSCSFCMPYIHVWGRGLSRKIDMACQFLEHERISVQESNEDLSPNEGDLFGPGTTRARQVLGIFSTYGQLSQSYMGFINRLVRDHGAIDLEWLRDAPQDKPIVHHEDHKLVAKTDLCEYVTPEEGSQITGQNSVSNVATDDEASEQYANEVCKTEIFKYENENMEFTSSSSQSQPSYKKKLPPKLVRDSFSSMSNQGSRGNLQEMTMEQPYSNYDLAWKDERSVRRLPMAVNIDLVFLKAQVRAANCNLAMGSIGNAKKQYTKCLESGTDNILDRKVITEISEDLE